MSLINQMLKDLEKRTNEGPPSATCLSSQVTSVSASRRYRKVLWGGLSLLLVCAGVVWFVEYGRPRVLVNRAGEADVVQASESAGAINGLSEGHPTVSQPAMVTADKLPTNLEMVRMQQQDDQLQIELVFSSAPVYGLARGDQGRQLVLDVPGGVMTASLPNTAGLPLLHSVASQSRESGVQLMFSFNQSCRYDALVLSENSVGPGQTLSFMVQAEPVEPAAAALQALREIDAPPVSLAATTQADKDSYPVPSAVSSKPEQSVVRQEVQLSPRARAANYFRDAGVALQQGRQREAEAALRAALALDPVHVEVRDMLLRLLVQQNRRADYRALLADGLRQDPQYLPYRVQYARLLVQDGALSEARDHLTREPRPPVIEALDLYAMLATVYQRQGQYVEAAQTYRALLAVKPEQSVWWMGLGIALEGATLEDQAQQAYRQAISRGGLSSGLQTYIRQRLTVLGNRGAQAPATSMSAGKEPS